MKNTVLITGTNRGIGLEFAKQYAEAGWDVMACSRHPEANALQDLKRKHSNVSVWELDVCNEEQIKNLANNLQEKPIDLLINSAGIYGHQESDEETHQPLMTVTPEAMLKVYKVNCVAPVMVTRSLLNNIGRSELKTIVTISSRAGSIGDNTSGDTYAYRPSKAAVNMVMKSLAVDLKPQNIKVLLLSPGWVKTDMGGPDALIDAQTSVKRMRQIIDDRIQNPTIETGDIFYHYNGEKLPW
jgi:NAD(P)-dependent dehydrogenase (short-subunit alcohol dehydrogenase family)